ncbi:MAG: hypothetical protein ACKO7P_15805 [Bacteroidota bacterium]
MKSNNLVYLLVIFFLVTSMVILKDGKCGLEILDSYTQEIMGKNVGFYVKFKNNSKKNIDAFDYKVKYLDGFNELKGTNEYRWQAGNLINDLEPGETLKDGATNWVKGANKIKVQIIRVHFTDGTVCK